jgi:hypothetical protein
MNITIDVDPTGWLRATDTIRRGFPDIVARALNRSAEEIQDRLQLEEHRVFVVRSQQSSLFLSRLIKITKADRANAANGISASVRIEGPGNNPGAAAVLTRHILGGTHTKPGTAANAFAIPSHYLRPSPYTVIPRSLFPKALGLADRRDVTGIRHARRKITSGGAVQIRGKQRTFILAMKGSMGLGRALGVYQRLGKDDIQLLFLYSPTIRLRPRFNFEGLAQRVAAERLPANMTGYAQQFLKMAAAGR